MAGDGSSYLQEYGEYFKNFQDFVSTLNYEDDLLPSNLKCRTGQEELVGECVEWTLRYLRLTKCPQSLLSFLTKSALDRVKLKNDDYPQEGILAPNMVEIVNEVCLQYCGENNPALRSLPPPSAPLPVISTCAIKNSRRRMENRHAVVEDLDTIFNVSSSCLTNYYGIFDGHSGVDASTYCSTHMHCFVAQSPNYPSDPEKALLDAFAKTESLFAEKCRQENINGGCTALCVLYRPLSRQLYTAWVGDSQAIVVSQSKIYCLVNPHKPNRPDEQARIEKAGGVVLHYGTWRVNGQLAVSRAIGDVKHKQFVSGVPEITPLNLNGDEDFLVLGCDGLWDSVKEEDVAATVYEQLQSDPGDVLGLSQTVVSLARRAGSQDNISVLVVLLRPASQIVCQLGQSGPTGLQPEVVAVYRQPASHMDILDAVDNASNPFLPSTNGLRDDGGLLGAFDASPSDQVLPGRKDEDDEEDDEDDLGPETDVDAVDDADDVDDVLVSPSAPVMTPAIANPFLEKTSLDKNEVLALALGSGDDDQPNSLEPLDADVLSSSQLAKGGAEVVENVEESESEDEWNYYTTDRDPGPEVAESGSIEDMESQLNPNAAVFVPLSPTQEEFFNKTDVMSSSFIAPNPVSALESSPMELLNKQDDEVWLSGSPKKGGVPLDNVQVPPEDEFDQEASQRPSDLDDDHGMGTMNGENLIKQEEASQENLVSSKIADQKESFNPFVDPENDNVIFTTDGEVEVSDKVMSETIPTSELVVSHVEDSVSEAPEPTDPLRNFLEDDSTDLVSGLKPADTNFNVIENNRSVSPIVSGLSDNSLMGSIGQLQSGIVPANQHYSESQSFGIDHESMDAAPEPLNDGVLYSTSGFDHVMEAPSVFLAPPVTSFDQASAQSTPFEDEQFEFGNTERNTQEEEAVVEVDRSAFSQQVEAQVHSYCEQGEDLDEGNTDEGNTEMRNDLNRAFTNSDAPIPEEAGSHDQSLALTSEDILEFGSTAPASAGEQPPLSPRLDDVVASIIRSDGDIQANLPVGEFQADSDAKSDSAAENFQAEIPVCGTQPMEPAGTIIAELPSSINHAEVPPVSDFKIESSDEFQPLMETIQEDSPISNVQEEMHVFERQVEVQSSLESPLLDQAPKHAELESESPVRNQGAPLVLANEPVTASAVTDAPMEAVLLENHFADAPPSDLGGSTEQSSLNLDIAPCLSPAPVSEEVVEPKSVSDLNAALDAPPSQQEDSVAPESTPLVGVAAASAVGVVAAGLAAAGAAVVGAGASKTDKKLGSKAPVTKGKPSPAKAPLKTAPKTATATATVPKKPAAPVPATRKVVQSTTVAKTKPSEGASKSAVPTKPAQPKPRTAPVAKASVTEKKPLTNGDAAKVAPAKPLPRPASRPATAPARTTVKPTTSTTATSSVTSKAPATSASARAPIKRVPATVPAATKSKVTETKPKSELKTTVGAVSKPRPATATGVASAKPPSTSARAALPSKPIDKQSKETTNKLISATRSTTSRTTATTKVAASKTTSAAPSTMSKPAPIRKPQPTTGPAKAPISKKPGEPVKDPLTNGVVKNGHLSPDEIPVQNGVSHSDPVIDNRESDLKLS